MPVLTQGRHFFPAKSEKSFKVSNIGQDSFKWLFRHYSYTTFVLSSRNFGTLPQCLHIWKPILPYRCCQCRVVPGKSLQMKMWAKGKPLPGVFMFLPIWCTNNFARIGYIQQLLLLTTISYSSYCIVHSSPGELYGGFPYRLYLLSV